MSSIIEKLMPSRHANGNGEQEIAVSLLTVTPQVALDLLELNTHNRPISKAQVAAYARAMSSGRWRPGVADICVDKAGVLLNGQHTLAAVMQSGCTIVVTLKTGLSVTDQDTMDAQRKRSVGQQLAIEGVKHANSVAAIGKIVLGWRSTGGQELLTPSDVKSLSPKTPQDRLDVLAFCRDNQAELETVAGLAKRWYGKSGGILNESTIGTLTIVFRDAAPEHGQAWLDQLFGEVDECAQPIAAYRTRLTQLKASTSEWPVAVKYAFAIKSFNAFMARQQIKKFQLRPGEKPVITVPEGVN
jgi:hypothetical protein